MNLSMYIQKNLKIPFQWGSNDCITFTCGWIQDQTGHDYLTAHRPWRTAREAHKKLRDLQGLFFLFDENFKRINPALAIDGDIAIYENTACIFSGRHIVSVGTDGLVFNDRIIASCAWRF
jgi:hypothetical protein